MVRSLDFSINFKRRNKKSFYNSFYKLKDKKIYGKSAFLITEYCFYFVETNLVKDKRPLQSNFWKNVHKNFVHKFKPIMIEALKEIKYEL